MTHLSEAKHVLAQGEVLLVNILEEARSVVVRLEVFVEELYQTKTSINSFNDIFDKKNIDLETKTFLSEMTYNFQLQNDIYIEEFIALGGSTHLMSLAVMLDGSVLGYCLRAFYITTIYFNGVEFIRQRPENVYKLYELLEKDDSTVKKNTLGILCSLLRDMKGAFSIINKVAVTHGFKKERSPYSPLIDALVLKDLDLKERVLNFFNWMIFKCQNEEQCCKFQSRLENLGVYEECMRIHTKSNEKLRKQLMIFQQNCNIVIKSSMYELEIHKNRINQLERN